MGRGERGDEVAEVRHTADVGGVEEAAARFIELLLDSNDFIAFFEYEIGAGVVAVLFIGVEHGCPSVGEGDVEAIVVHVGVDLSADEVERGLVVASGSEE